MNDKQQLLIDCISLLPVIGILVLITVANDQLVTMVAAYVLCGELLCVLVSRILNLYYIDVAFVWLGGIMLWLWYWLWLESSHVVMEIVEKAVEWIASFSVKIPVAAQLRGWCQFKTHYEMRIEPNFLLKSFRAWFNLFFSSSVNLLGLPLTIHPLILLFNHCFDLPK